MRLVAGQRLWASRLGSAFRESRVASVGRVWAQAEGTSGLRSQIAIESDGIRLSPGDWPVEYYTDDQRAVAEEARARATQSAAVAKACRTADLPTLNKIAALLGLPEVVAWTPENPT